MKSKLSSCIENSPFFSSLSTVSSELVTRGIGRFSKITICGICMHGASYFHRNDQTLADKDTFFDKFSAN